MKDKLLSVFVAFVRKTFTKDRLLDLIDDLLDIVFDRYGSPNGNCDYRMIDQDNVFSDMKEALDKDV